jgi:hypothetical protein
MIWLTPSAWRDEVTHLFLTEVPRFKKEMWHWPDMCCADTCCLFLPVIQREIRGIFQIIEGHWDGSTRCPDCRICPPSEFCEVGAVGHVWIEWRPQWKRSPDDTIIIDPTYGQFTLKNHGRDSDPSEILCIVFPRDPNYKDWRRRK